MRKLPAFILALLLGLAAVGCDSNDDESEADLFVGSWTMVEFSDGGGDKMPLFNQIANSLTADLNNNNTFEIHVDYKPASGNAPLTIPGTYTVNEGANSLEISPPTGQTIAFIYDFESDDRVTLSTGSAFINGLFQTNVYTGTVVLTIERD